MRKKDFINPVDPFHRDLERFFQNFFHPNHPIHLLSGGSWSPLADIYEKGGHLVIKMELPGMSQKNISVSIEGNKLRVRGMRDHEREPGVTYHQMEINYGPFERCLVLPVSMHEGNVSAEYREGFLYITVRRGA
jgi:HSP20 family protein